MWALDATSKTSTFLTTSIHVSLTLNRLVPYRQWYSRHMAEVAWRHGASGPPAPKEHGEWPENSSLKDQIESETLTDAREISK